MSRKIVLSMIVLFVLLAIVAGMVAAYALGDGFVNVYAWNCYEEEDAAGEFLRCAFVPQVENPKYGLSTPEVILRSDGRYIVKMRIDQPRCLECS